MNERRLLAWIAEALEPGEAEDVAAALRADPALAARAEELRRRVADLREERGWSLPPPGVAAGRRPFAMRLEASAFAEPAVRPGEAFRLRLEDPGPPARLVVVLIQAEAGWEVLAPGSPEELVRLDELEPAGEGAWDLDLIAPELQGPQRWAVALPSADIPIDWSRQGEARWAALIEAIQDGTAPVSVLRLG